MERGIMCPDRRGVVKIVKRKLTSEQVRRIRDGKEALKMLAGELGISMAAVHKVRRKETYKNLP